MFLGRTVSSESMTTNPVRIVYLKPHGLPTGKSSAVQRYFLFLSPLIVCQVPTSSRAHCLFCISLLYLQEVTRGQFKRMMTEVRSQLIEEPPRPIPTRRASKNNTHRNSPFPFRMVYKVISALLAGG